MPTLSVEAIVRHWEAICSHCIELLFPPYCVSCQQLGAWLCQVCQDRSPRVVPPFCIRCGDAVAAEDLCTHCQTTPLQLDCVRSVFYFEGPMREAVHAFKYNGLQVLAEPLATMMAHYWTAHPLPAQVLVPVPLHASRQRERGYNQAELLARGLERQIGLPVDPLTLVRHRPTAPQVELDAIHRKQNVAGAFKAENGSLSGQDVLLIDDVCTTAATLDACAIALRQAGARSVCALTLARAR